MTNLEIQREQFPQALAEDAKVGDLITLTLTGRIVNIEADVVDISGIAGFDYQAGSVTTTLLITSID